MVGWQMVGAVSMVRAVVDSGDRLVAAYVGPGLRDSLMERTPELVYAGIPIEMPTSAEIEASIASELGDDRSEGLTETPPPTSAAPLQPDPEIFSEGSDRAPNTSPVNVVAITIVIVSALIVVVVMVIRHRRLALPGIGILGGNLMADNFTKAPKDFLETEANHRDQRKFKALHVGIGVLIGIFLASLVVYLLFITGVFDQALVTRSLPSASEICPTAEAITPVCPTCAPTDTPETEITSTPTATFTATPNFAATATAACESFNSRFPGTPCPPFSTATP